MKNLFLCALLSVTASAWAQAPANVEVKDAWVRATVAQQKSTGAFMQLTAKSDARVIEARSPIAGVTQIHEMAMEKDVMKMRQIPGLDLAAGRTLELKPGGYHVMLMDLKQPLKAGERVAITLVFEDAAKKRFTQEIQAPIHALSGAQGQMKHGAGHGEHKH